MAGAAGERARVQPRVGRPRDPRLDAAIVDATVTLLEERGYAELTLTAVAERAGTTTPAIYRRFGSKAELVSHAVFRTDGDDVVADTGDLAADLTTMIRWSVEKLCRPAALAAIAGILGESRPERIARADDAMMANARVAERLDRAKAAGDVRADVTTSVLVSLISGPVMHAVLAGEADRVDDAWVADLVEVVLGGVSTESRMPREGRLEHR
jgi:AcrR family transcriptional regulator